MKLLKSINFQNAAHESHEGIVAMKGRLEDRDKVTYVRQSMDTFYSQRSKSIEKKRFTFWDMC